MRKEKTTQNTDTQNAAAPAQSEVEVLYQKMGDRWFAFSMVGDEVFVGSISQEKIDEAEAIKNKKKRGADQVGNA